MDPDNNEYSGKREKTWKGVFGQAGSSQSHLNNNRVGPGDVFLYFGWFQNTICSNGKYVYDKNDKHGKHVIYGYLQVGEVIKVNKIIGRNWYDKHPHARRRERANDNDVIYITTDKFSVDNNLKGYGIFKYNDLLKLSNDGLSKSKWELPEILKNVDITYHSKESWKDDYFQSAANGQEFVIDCNDKIEKWIELLIGNGMAI